MRHKLVRISLILAVAVAASAQQTHFDNNTPSVDRLRSHITYLASDKLEGRRTGSPGADAAAEYIAREFSRIGLRRSIGRDLPGMSILEADSPRRYMQEFPFVSGVTLGKKNSMLFTTAPQARAQEETTGSKPSGASTSQDLRLGEDWMPLGFSSSATLTNTPGVFVGYGIKADEMNYDDYANAQVSGRVAIALAGTPDGDNPHGKFAHYEGVRGKAIAARNSGAAALIVIASETDFKDARLSHLSYDNSSGEAGLPVVVISRQAAAQMLGLENLAMLARIENTVAAWVQGGGPMQKGNKPWGVTTNFRPEIFGMVAITTEIIRQNAPAYNVVGILDGSDPILKKEVIVIGAHYDHLGRGGEGSLATREGEIHHGADDNASGVAGMLELARLFARNRMILKRTIVFIAFSGEEEGLLGSNFYVNHPIEPLDSTVAMINMDMIGRMKDNKLIIGGVGTAQQWREWIQAENTELVGSRGPEGLKRVTAAAKFTLSLNDDGYGPSDHSSFYAKKVPVLFFFTGSHEDYHKPTDTADKINYADEARVVSFVFSLVRTIDSNSQRPAYAVAKSDSQGRSMGFRVYLGTIPNYSESNDGLRLDGVREDSPAAKAGLMAGDRVIRMAGREVHNVSDYTYVLGEMKAGQEYEIEIVRGTETLKLKITPLARK